MKTEIEIKAKRTEFYNLTQDKTLQSDTIAQLKMAIATLDWVLQ